MLQTRKNWKEPLPYNKCHGAGSFGCNLILMGLSVMGSDLQVLMKMIEAAKCTSSWRVRLSLMDCNLIHVNVTLLL